MFIHKGKARTFRHNLGVASLLSFVAGIVNVAGLLGVGRLTTNVTGHFAFFMEELYEVNLYQALNYLLYIIFFFLGSFVSSFIVEVNTRKSEKFIFVVPVIIEVLIITAAAISVEFLLITNKNVIACSLLFAMGLQNSLVTTLSNAVVRTTHLTGLFTDLGIECSQLFFFRKDDQKKALISSIKLRLIIIVFFFLGGTVAGIVYNSIQLLTLLIAAFVLSVGLLYDYTKTYLVLHRSNRKHYLREKS